MMAANHARKLMPLKVPRSFYSAPTTGQQQSLASNSLQIASTPEGLTVASLENHSPNSNVSIFARAGSRYETEENAGISSLLAACTGLKTENFLPLIFKRQLGQWGATVTCKRSREFLQYSLSVPRLNLGGALEILADAMARPTFRPWQVQEQFKLLAQENKLAPPEDIVMELLHKAAYRNTSLGNTVFFPDYQLKKISSDYVWYNTKYNTAHKYDNTDQLVEFYNKTHTIPRLTFVGVGVDNGVLVKMANSLDLPVDAGEKPTPATYLGGEIRQETGCRVAHVAVACPGVGIDSQDLVPLMIAQHILGVPSAFENAGNFGSKIGSAIASAGGKGSGSAFNINYSDSGLFGVYITVDSAKVNESVKSVVKAIRGLKITEQDLEVGKRRAKCTIFAGKDGSNTAFQMANFASTRPELLNPSDLLATIDKTKLSSVQNALANVLKGRITMSSYGGVHNVPYIDEL